MKTRPKKKKKVINHPELAYLDQYSLTSNKYTKFVLTIKAKEACNACTGQVVATLVTVTVCIAYRDLYP